MDNRQTYGGRARGLAGYDVAFTPKEGECSDIHFQNNLNPNGFTCDSSGIYHPFIFTKCEIDRHIEEQSLGLSDKTCYWKRRIGEIFWDHTQGILSEETIANFRAFVINHYTNRDARLKVFFFVRKFLQEQSLKKGYNLEYLRSKLVLPKNLKVRSLNQRVIIDADITNLIQHIEEGELPHQQKKEFIAIVLFLAYTGQRPVVADTLEVWQLSSVLEKNMPTLEVLGEQDKTRIDHHVPLHPQLIPILKEIIKGKKPDSYVFRKNPLMRWLKNNPLPLIHTTDKILVKDLRKYFEQKCDLMDFNETYKNMIMCHGLSSVQFRSYKQVTHIALYEKYMEKWGDVLLFPFPQ